MVHKLIKAKKIGQELYKENTPKMTSSMNSKQRSEEQFFCP